MRSSLTSPVVLLGLAAGLATAHGCSSGGGGNGIPPTSGAAGTGAAGTGTSGAAGTGTAGMATAGTGAAGDTGAGTAGTTAVGTAGTTGAGTAGAGGTTAAGTAGAGGTTGAGTAGAGGAAAAGTAGTTSTPGPVGGAITKVLPTSGCGMDPTGFTPGTLVSFTIQTSGNKAPNCADSKCGAWTYTREYFVQLPTGYDKTKAYPLLFEGPYCGGKGNNLYKIPAFDSSVIRVGLSPSADAQVFHSTYPGQGCFDDREGDDSVDWVFYEKLYDQLAGQLCFDRNRVFAAGRSGGGWLANELGCKYAGDAIRPVRGIMVESAGLPTDPKFVPTCTSKPMAGFWSHELNDGTNPFAGDVVAMNRALVVNGCTPAGVTYQTATFDPFPISATDGTSCKKFQGCPDLAPLVVCGLPGNGKSDHASIVVPGWATFLKVFSTPPLLTP
jgi:hypothetical protein